MAVVAATHPTAPLVHGALQFPGVTVDGYALDSRDAAGGFVGDRANDESFRAIVERFRGRCARLGADPLRGAATARLRTAEIEALLDDPSLALARLLADAIDEFARGLGHVIRRFREHRGWQDLDRIVIGGGLGASRIGRRVMQRLAAQGGDLPPLVQIRHPSDDAGLVGCAHLPPRTALAAAEGMLALDIGRTKLRAGLVLPRLDASADLAAAELRGKEIWRHAGQAPTREAMLDGARELLLRQIAAARTAGLGIASTIGIACPGTIDAAGRISRGAQNLPSDWQDPGFNLPLLLAAALPPAEGDTPFAVIMHNDAVVQGLSQLPFMADVERWAILTIGTGLGNACFTNH
jgi:hypothetical protein